MIAPGFALVFDLDGVIVDSMPMHAEAWRVYLKRHGASVTDLDARMHGRRNDEIVEEFLGRALSPAAIFEHGSAKERLFREMMQPQLDRHIVTGVLAFLERANGTPMAVASNAERANIDFVLDGAGIRGRFQHVVDGNQVERAKPAPDIYLRAAALLGISPGHCVVFEDSPTGIEAATRAGTRVVGVGTHTLDLPPVDLLIRDFNDPALLPWLAEVR